jgi:hypothetical protein
VIRDEQSDGKKAGWLSMFKGFFPGLVTPGFPFINPVVVRFVSEEYIVRIGL